MPYLRQRAKVPATGRVTVKLVPLQRDQVLGTGRLPRGLGHSLHHAPVARGKLEVRVTREELDALIASAIQVPAAGREEERALDVFVRYLENRADQFEEKEGPQGGVND